METKKGFSLIEILLYLTILVIIAAVVVNTVIGMMASLGKAKMIRALNEQGISAMERIIREIRLAKSIDSVASTFGLHPGILALNTFVSSSDLTETTRTFSLQSGTLMLQEGGDSPIVLTSGVTVSNLIFRNAVAPSDYYFVRGSYAGCSDGNSGTSPANPFCTIERAASLVQPGTIVFVGAGTYNVDASGGIRPANDGTSTEPIIFLGDFDGTYTGDAGSVIIQGGVGPAFDLISRSYIHIISFTIQNSTNGIVFENTATTNSIGVRIENNTFMNISGAAAINNENGTDQNMNRDHVIRGNLIYNNTARAMHFDRVANVLIENNVTYSNGTDNIEILAMTGTIRNNLIYKANTPREGIDIRGRTGWETNLMIINNTIYANRQGIEIIGASGQSITVSIQDNIFKNNTQDGIRVSDTTGVTCEYSYNMFHNNAVTSCTNMGNNITTDPWLVDPDGADNILGGINGNDDRFQLSHIAAGQSIDSPAIDGGSQSASVANLDTRTTRTDNVADTHTVDLGFHYATTSFANPVFAIGSVVNPLSQAIKIELTLEGGAGIQRVAEKFYGTAVLRNSYIK